MSRTYRPSLMALFAVIACFMLGTSAQAASEKYCSPYNTANDDVYTWPWQSNGNCTNHCQQEGSYAFAVLQYQDCYCSNYVPDPTYGLGDCGKGCPGFPAENCGDKDKGLFLYLQLAGQPSGTKGAGGSSQPTSSAVVVSSSPPPPPPTPSSTSRQTSSVPPVSVPQSSKASSTPQPTSQAPSPQTSEQVVTEGGNVITKTIVVSSPANPTSSSEPVKTGSEKSSTNVAAVAGGVAGGIIGLLAIVGGILFVLYRRRRQRRQSELDVNGGGSGGITRNVSTMSKAGLLGRTTEVEQQPYRPPLNTTFGTQNSRYGADNQSVSPISNRRNSQPLVIDSRMNPQAMIEYAGANASRESIGTIDDSRDYGRKLDVRNPDP